jgi:catechol 2,3-dioxygenase-like lactoylglutathione lyase family enzyme
MKWTLEVVVVPVLDVDRAKAFYIDQLGFVLDHDRAFSDELRVVQLTPPGSACSIVIGTGIAQMPPGSIKGLQLVVPDVIRAHAELVERGVEVSDVQGIGPQEPQPAGADTSSGRDPSLVNAGFVFFDDPDGNGWAVQQMAGHD